MIYHDLPEREPARMVLADVPGRAGISCSPVRGEQRDQILVCMTHRHLAIFRTRVKPCRAYSSSGPVCR
jgi:hypothetical protein